MEAEAGAPLAPPPPRPPDSWAPTAPTTSYALPPSANYNGSVDPGLTFRAWDQTTGANGGTANVSTNGGTTAYSTATETAAITVNAVNDAPVLDNTGTMTVTAINEDETNPAGITIANLIASAGGDRITDADAGAVEGIAVTTVDNTNGTWQYSTDGGGKLSNLWHPHRRGRPTLGRRQRQQPHTLCAQCQLHRQRRPGPSPFAHGTRQPAPTEAPPTSPPTEAPPPTRRLPRRPPSP